MKTVEIHLGRPFAAQGSKCIYCGKPATRTSKMEGSVTDPEGVKHSFTKIGMEVTFCDDHGVLIKEAT